MVNADFAATALWSGLLERPDTFPPSAHTTDVSTITDSGAQNGYIASWVGGHMKFVPPGSVPGVGSGSVTRFWFTNANGIAGEVTDPETQPRLKLKLNDITPLSVTSPGNIASGGILTGATIVSIGDITDGGDLLFTKVGARIKADLTNATRANRLLFQTSTANTNSLVGVLPSGSGTIAGWRRSAHFARRARR